MDLSLDMWMDNGALKGMIEYRSDLFERTSVKRMAEHLQVLCLSLSFESTPHNSACQFILLKQYMLSLLDPMCTSGVAYRHW